LESITYREKKHEHSSAVALNAPVQREKIMAHKGPESRNCQNASLKIYHYTTWLYVISIIQKFDLYFIKYFNL
jgi:hypothetical protein